MKLSECFPPLTDRNTTFTRNLAQNGYDLRYWLPEEHRDSQNSIHGMYAGGIYGIPTDPIDKIPMVNSHGEASPFGDKWVALWMRPVGYRYCDVAHLMPAEMREKTHPLTIIEKSQIG